MSILKQILKEAAEIDSEATEVVDEVAGQDGITPINHPKTRNRTNKSPEYYVVVDPHKVAIPDYDSKFVTANFRFTHGVTVSDFGYAFKTTDSKKALQFLFDVIRKYPTYNVALLRDNWSYAPVSFGGSQQRRPGVIDCWVHGTNGLPGYWNRDAKYLKFLDRSIDFNNFIGEADEIDEEFNFDNANYVRLYELQEFYVNAKSILADFGGYGFCVLRDKAALYGLMFKGVGEEAGKKILKFHIYSYPQEGLIRGGQTFFTTSDGIKDAIQKALTQIH